MKNFLKKSLIKTSAYFTIAVTLFSFVVLFTNSNDESVFLDPSRILLLLPFCLCFAIANTMIKYKDIGAVTRWLTHAALVIISAYLFIILPAGFEHSSGKFMGLIIVCAIYVVCILIYALFSVRIKNTLAEDKKLKNK